MIDFGKIRKLFASVRSYLPQYCAALLGVSIRNFAITYLGASLLSIAVEAATHQDFQGYAHRLLLLLGLLLLFVLFDAFAQYWFETTVHKMTMMMRHKAYERILRAEGHLFTQSQNRSGLVARLNQDVSLASSIWESHLLTPLMFAVSGIGATISIARHNMLILAFLYACGALIYAAQHYLGKKKKRVTQAIQAEKEGLYSIFMKAIDRALEARMLGHAKPLSRWFAQRSRSFVNTAGEDQKIEAQSSLVSALSDFFSFGGVMLLGLLLYALGKMDIAQIAFIAPMGGLIISMITSFGRTYISLQHSLAGFDRIGELMSLPLENLDGETAPEDRNTPYAVSALHVTSCVGGTSPAFSDTTFNIPSGLMTAITGKSGTGKSSFFKTLLGLYPYEGEALMLWDREVRNYEKLYLRMNISYLAQENIIVSGTIAENLLLGNPNASIPQVELEAATRLTGADEWIARRGGYQVRLTEGGAELSGGERQMLGLARAVLRDCPVMLLDESFAGIHKQNAIAILNRLKATGKTILLISHDDELSDCCDHIVKM